MHSKTLGRLWRLTLGVVIGLGLAPLSHAAVTGEWQVTLTRSGTSVQPASTGATQESAWSACQSRIPRTATARTTYNCQTPRYVAVVTPEVAPPPGVVDCVVSPWSEWAASSPWSACANGTQSRTESRLRTITTQPANGGVACPVLSGTRTVSQECTVDPPPPPPSGNEVVGSWAQRTFASPFRLNMEPGSYPVWVAGGAIHQNLAGAWDGTRFARIFPPTQEQIYGGIGSFPLPSGVNTLSVRWEMRAGPTFASGGQGFVDNKHVIIHAGTGDRHDRAMMNIQRAPGNCLQMAIAQGTTKQFNQSAQGGNPIGWYREENNDLFRWCDTASHAKAIPAGEWLSIELQVSCGNSLHPSGHIRGIVTRRSGQRYDWWIPWNYDAGAQRCVPFTAVEGIGDYFNGRGNGAAGTYFDIAGVTFATNRGLLGPRAGFVQ